MKLIENNKLIFLMYILLISVVIIAIASVIIYESHTNRKILEVCNVDIGYFQEVDGIYNGAGFYCVKTENLNFDEIKQIEYHEHCHYLVHNNYDHFCDEKYNGGNK